MRSINIYILILLTTMLNGLSLSGVEINMNVTMKLNKTSQLVKMTQFEWIDSKTWLNKYMHEFTYDDSGLTSESFGSVWYNESWKLQSKTVYTLNPQGFITTKTIYSWTGYWSESTRYRYFYDSSWLNTSILVEQWDGVWWSNDFRYFYTYDEFNNNTEILVEQWYEDPIWGYQWNKVYRTLKTYIDRLKVEAIEYHWDRVSSWINDYKYDYSYIDSNLTVDIKSNWADGQWDNYSKNIYTYNLDGYINEKEYYLWNNTDSIWDYSTKNNYTYDNDGNEVELIIYNFTDPNWTYSRKIEKVYENVTSIENENIPENIFLYQNYPNPFNPVTEIKFSIEQTQNVNLSIFNSKGELVQTLFEGEKEKGNHSIKFDASRLNSGVYFYKLSSNNINFTRKMLFLK